MTAAKNEESYVLNYRLRSHDFGDPHRTIRVHASQESIGRLVEDGYLLREGMIERDQLEALRTALDEVVEAESGARSPKADSEGSRRFGGVFVRHLMDKHPAFLDLLRFEPILSVVRAVLGPQVQMRGVSARVVYPDQPDQETEWHFHQRLIPDPLPPFFSRPHTVEALVYLDEADDSNGPLCVVPGSHQRIGQDLPLDDYADKPDQVVLRVPAGGCVFAHGALWHRAMPNRPDGTVRRLLILGYGPTWMKSSIYGERPAHPLTDSLLPDADQETRELLGVDGWM
ncbi:phytanoyl-CoA dioxygenase family protein [Actinopolymorpha singaporensis]|uniref:Phytanoyl-CoA dioxygenase (PhyH) n=1 Tax=Actinopolymorpha singaporensis TaxID=117157 RepID=A0A1H1QZC3_9ACTN|nr:phytanoyl-CoA dioxygenase family protein [Actinopolymorpha singaporensis]SDS28847.1 Phytanoyl-CoA dioxygenase (PhyH) [Actinopolymorpha singaporensis]